MSVNILIAFLLAYSGMLGLCLGLERHFKQLWLRTPAVSLRRALRAAGWLGLIASVAVSAQAWGWAMGAVAAFGLISLAALAIAMLLPYAGRWVVAVAVIGWPLAGFFIAL